MKKVIALAIMMFAGVFAANAQSAKTQNEGYVGYTFLRQDVKIQKPSFKFDSNTDSHGFTVGYTRYTKGEKGKVGTLGLTGEFTANFDSNDASLVTVMVGPTLKARNSSVVQPYVRVLGGVAREHVNRYNLTDTSDVSFAVDGGAGLEFSLSKNSRYALRTGVDAVSTSFHGDRNLGARLSLGLTF